MLLSQQYGKVRHTPDRPDRSLEAAIAKAGGEAALGRAMKQEAGGKKPPLPPAWPLEQADQTQRTEQAKGRVRDAVTHEWQSTSQIKANPGIGAKTGVLGWLKVLHRNGEVEKVMEKAAHGGIVAYWRLCIGGAEE
jgi:hypothetical protein